MKVRTLGPAVDDQLEFGEDPHEDADRESQAARFYLERAREKLPDGGGKPFVPRACKWCGSTNSTLREKNGQNTVYCDDCGRHYYNAPKVETGQRPRTVATVRASIKPLQQARILDRDQGRCVLCGTREHLTIGHLLSIEEAYRMGEVGPELHDDANLAAMCEACNLGLGRHSVSPRTYAVIMYRLVQAEVARGVRASSTPPGPGEQRQLISPAEPPLTPQVSGVE